RLKQGRRLHRMPVRTTQRIKGNFRPRPAMHIQALLQGGNEWLPGFARKMPGKCPQNSGSATPKRTIFQSPRIVRAKDILPNHHAAAVKKGRNNLTRMGGIPTANLVLEVARLQPFEVKHAWRLYIVEPLGPRHIYGAQLRQRRMNLGSNREAGLD